MKLLTTLLLISSLFYACERDEDEPTVIIKENNEKATLNFDPPNVFFYGTEAPDSIEIEISNGTPPYTISDASFFSQNQIIRNKLVLRPDRDRFPGQKTTYGYINIEDNAGNKNTFNYTIGTLLNYYDSIANSNIDGSGKFTFSETNLKLEATSWNEFSNQLSVTILNDVLELTFRIGNISEIASFIPDYFEFKYYGSDPNSFFLYELNPQDQNISITEITKKTIKGKMDLQLAPNNFSPGTPDDLNLKVNFEIKR